MAALATVDALDERVARGVAFEAREIRDRAGGARQASSYIQGFIGDYLDDTAAVLRQLQACGGDSGAAARRLARTLEWREETKVYPARRQAAAPLVVNADGLVVVRSRQAPLLAAQRGREGYMHGVGALEDARVGLRAAYERFGVAAQAAVVVAVETLRLAEVGADTALELAAVAAEHYPQTVARVYVTAASSVLLEHARLALQPALRKLDARQRQRIVFMRADALSAEMTEIGEYMLQKQRQQQQQQQRPRPLLSVVERVRGVLSRSASSIFSGDSEAGDSDDFRTACGEQTPEPEPARSVLSLEFHGKGATAGQNGTLVVEAANALTPVQLASLQRAVQGVQRMLGSIGEGFGGADPAMALAATKSKLAQQADLLMSTVAALSAAVSMRRPEPPAPTKQRAFYVAPARPAGATAGGGVGSWLGGLALQLLALPLGLLFGRRRDAMAAALRALLARAVRTTLRRLRRRSGLHTLLLLAYNHLHVYAVVLWTSALLAWQANAALIAASLSKQLHLGIAY